MFDEKNFRKKSFFGLNKFFNQNLVWLTFFWQLFFCATFFLADIFIRLVVRLVVRLVRLVARLVVKLALPLLTLPSCTVGWFFKDPKTIFFLNAKITKTERKKNRVIVWEYLEDTIRPEVSTTSRRGCFAVAQTHRHTHRRTDGHCD